MEQRERLEYLAKWFLADTELKWGVAFPGDEEGQRRLLRSLMNVRMPGPVPPEVLGVQDAYLRERAREKGIVQISDIPAIASLGSAHPFAEILSISRDDDLHRSPFGKPRVVCNYFYHEEVRKSAKKGK